MYRKTKKLFAVALVVSMILTMGLFGTTASAAATSNRLEGGDRYATALNIVGAGWTSSEYAVLATGEGYADALAAAPLAKAYNAPILLVDPTTDNAAVKAKLTALGVSKVFIVGGEGVVSKAFADSLTATVTRLGGLNRVETSVKVATQLVAKVGTITEIAVANEDSYADALSMAPIAANKNMPILLTSADSLPAEVSAFLAGKAIAKTYVLGGTGVVSEAVKALLPGAVRLGGANRYATNLAVLSNFADLNFANVVVAAGENYPDALAGSAYAAKLNAPMVLVDGTVDSATLAYVAGKATPATKVVALGGAAVVSDAAVAGLVTAINNATFQVTEIKAINARQLMVRFNKPVNEASAEATDKYHIGVNNPSTAVMQADEMSVLLTMVASLPTTATLYIVDPVALKADTNISTPIFTFVETYKDTVAPSVASVTYPVYNQAKITFSEPLATLPTPVVSGTAAADDSAITSLPYVTGKEWSAGAKELTYDLSAVKENTPVTVVFVGASDYAGNLITPNPTTVTFTKVKSDTTKPTVVAVTPLSNVRLSVTFSEALAGAPSVAVGSNNVTGWESTDNVTWTGAFTPTTGIANVAVAAGYADPSGNTGAAYSKLYEFKADSTAPVLVNYTVEVISSIPYLVFHYNEDVTPGSAVISGTRVKDYISYPAGGSAFAAAAYVNGTVTDAKAVMVDMSGWAEGAYTLTVAKGIALDKASPANESAAVSVSVTKGAATTPDSTVPTVSSFTMSANNDYATVVFSEEMDYVTAFNLANYKVNGQNVFTNAIFDQTATTVKLTVAPGTITYTGSYLVQVSGVKDEAGNAVTAYSAVKSFTENVRPYVASAKLTSSSTMTVTFSELVDVPANAFEVYVNGEKVASAVNALTADSKTVTVTFSAIDSLSKTVQVKLVDGTTVDQSGNFALTGTLVTAGF